MPQESISNPWDDANFLSKWTFHVANAMLVNGQQKTLAFDDLMEIPNSDRAEFVFDSLKDYYIRSKPIFFIPRLMVALFHMRLVEWLSVLFYTIVEGVIRIALPLLLVFLLDALQKGDDFLGYRWAGVIAALGLLQAVVHHVLFFISMRIGWNWKTSCTALIYDALFKLEGADMHSVQTGKMVNMISNDVSRIEEFAVVRLFLEIMNSMSILQLV